jgi:hypothetical protein
VLEARSQRPAGPCRHGVTRAPIPLPTSPAPTCNFTPAAAGVNRIAGVTELVRWRIGEAGWYLVVCGVLMVSGFAGTRLTVVVDDGMVTTTFRGGWPRRRIELDAVTATRHVQNSWGHGWGIRKIRNGWMFNIAGSEAIELTLRSGKVFRIGTDQPAELLAAIERAQTE